MIVIEVFKTNVAEREPAEMIIKRIQRINHDYIANFDLDDCDKILRVKALSGDVTIDQIIAVLRDSGFTGSVLE